MGKYQKILAKNELSHDDLLTLSAAKKMKSVLGAIVIVKHAGDTYMKMMEKGAYNQLCEEQTTA